MHLFDGFLLPDISVAARPGNAQSILETVMDLALESARARELEVAKTAARSSQSCQKPFLANMSHEIPHAYAWHSGNGTTCMDTEMSPESHEYVTTLRNAAEGLLHVLNDILDFSKIEAGKLTLENVSFSLRQMIEQARQIIVPQANAKGLKLTCHAAEDIPDLLVGDPARLARCW